MSWVVKTLIDGEYHGARRYWVKERSEAKRFVSREDAERFAADLDASYKPRVIRLVPKRKVEAMPEVDAFVLGREAEREEIVSFIERHGNPGWAWLAETIRAGGHRQKQQGP